MRSLHYLTGRTPPPFPAEPQQKYDLLVKSMLERLGRYEIKAELGRGGFGRVYRAFDPTMERMVAIKVLTADGDADLLVRFRNEAAASGGLRHPNIVTIHDFGEQDGVAYIVMELLDGEDLQHFIARDQSMTLLDKVHVISQVAAALGHAHAHGIIHRDVKPANVMLLHDGSVKIMDFGIALLAKGRHARLTPQGAVVGTFRYMAPEQFMGAEPDARSDIFSYGLVFYELLTGVHPFHASEAAALMYNILHLSPVPLRELLPDCPESLEAIVNRLLNREPDLRYQLLEDVLFDCEPVLLELRKAKATELVAHARRLKTETQSEAAQALIRQALELDPTNTAARALREELQKEFRKRAIQPRIRSLLRKAEEELTAGNFSEAIQRFESALRLDPEDVEIQRALTKARENFAESRRLEQLLADANHALHAGELASAQRHGSEAQRIAPDDIRVNEVMTRVQKALAERERQRRVWEEVDRARRLIEVEAWTEAGALLSKLSDEFPENKLVAALHAQAEAGKDEKVRQQRLSDGLSKAREEIQVGELESAVDRLQRLAAEFGTSSELQHLLSIAESERRGQLRRQLIDRTTAEAEALLLKDQFSEAKECIEAALTIYPGEPILERELLSIETAARRARRRAALQQALKSAEALRLGKRLEEALQVVEGFMNQYGAERPVEELRCSLDAEIEEERRAAALRQIVRHAKNLSSHENAEPAVEFLKQSVSRFQHQPQLLALLSAAETRLQEQRKREFVADLVSDSKIRIEAGDFEEAIQSLDEGLTKFPDDRQLLKQRADAAWRIEDRKRHEAIQIAAAEAKTQIQRGDFISASEIIAAAFSKYPDSQVLLMVQHQIESHVAEQTTQAPTPHAQKMEATSPRSGEKLPKEPGRNSKWAKSGARAMQDLVPLEPSVKVAVSTMGYSARAHLVRTRIHLWWLPTVGAALAVVSIASYLMLHRRPPTSHVLTNTTITEIKATPLPEAKNRLVQPSAATAVEHEPITRPVRMGTVVISTKLPGVEVATDSGPLGTTDGRGELSFERQAGTYLLRLTKSGFQGSQVRIVVREGRVIRVPALLSPVSMNEGTVSGSEHSTPSREGRVESLQPNRPILSRIPIPVPRGETTSPATASVHLPPPPEIQNQITPQDTLQIAPTKLPALAAPPDRPGSTKAGVSSVAATANDRGINFFKAANYAKAIASFNDALRATPDFTAAYVNRGAAYQALGKYKEAIADYSHALSLDPTDSTAGEQKKVAERYLHAGVDGIGAGATLPEVLSIQSPKYTKQAISAGVKGEVIVGAIVDERGDATDVTVLKSLGYGLDEAAIRVVKAAQFRPAQKNGRPVRFPVRLEVHFTER